MGALTGSIRLGLALFDRRKRAHLHRALTALAATPVCLCPCCGFSGAFDSAGDSNRPGALCPSCGAAERHRLLSLACVDGAVSFSAKRVLHFAPEAPIRALILSASDVDYQTADIEPGRAALTLDIERLDLPGDQFDMVVCSHVLEHVDDAKALPELFRVLKPGGQLVAMVPIVEGWAKSYEDPSKTTPRERELHFGQWDHVRFYGSDFRSRVTAAGFDLSEYTASGAQSVTYGLERGEKVFIATKPEKATPSAAHDRRGRPRVA